MSAATRQSAGEVAAAALAGEAKQFSERFARTVSALGTVQDPAIGTTPKDEIYRQDKLVLYRYRPLAGVARKVQAPLLICYALVNRPYMMDLQEDRSLIRGLLREGIDVYLIDWGYPDGSDRYLTMADYVQRYLPACVEQVESVSGSAKVNLLGVCQGGTLSLCYAALHPERVKNLITMVTPVDFQTPDNLLTHWARELDVDLLVSTLGNVSGDFLNQVFVSLMPFRLTSQKYVSLLDSVDNAQALANFMRMERWIFDSPDQPAEMFRQFMTWFYKQNRLIRGNLKIDGESVDLKRIKMPVFNLYATQDHLVPPLSARALDGLTGTRDYSSYEFPGGHIGIYVSGSAQREIAPRIGAWLRERDGIAVRSPARKRSGKARR
jgi:polyhydroxyalkanoate synthase subunit PhaC